MVVKGNLDVLLVVVIFVSDSLYYPQGGSVMRLFHKELEAYLVAEGLFDDCVTEDGKYSTHMVPYMNMFS